jgi:hypothetical protein
VLLQAGQRSVDYGVISLFLLHVYRQRALGTWVICTIDGPGLSLAVFKVRQDKRLQDWVSGKAPKDVKARIDVQRSACNYCIHGTVASGLSSRQENRYHSSVF